MKKYTQYKLYLKIRSPTCLNMHKYLVLTKFILVNNYIPKKKKNQIKSNVYHRYRLKFIPFKKYKNN